MKLKYLVIAILLSSCTPTIKNFDKYQLTVIDMNAPDQYIVVKENIDHKLTTNTFINESIYLEIFQDVNHMMVLNYNIL